ncbi:hypothetical protein [Streptomyces sp. NPDC051561]|uniref:hypothetical protein n=1 Tax=Streptomyces sp. NPDC051561 TaxID=3365658 RepID=UPI00379F235C
MKITFAYPRTTHDGTEYQPDQSADIDDAEAKQLVKDGFARPADQTTRASSKTLAPAGDRAESKGAR